MVMQEAKAAFWHSYVYISRTSRDMVVQSLRVSHGEQVTHNVQPPALYIIDLAMQSFLGSIAKHAVLN